MAGQSLYWQDFIIADKQCEKGQELQNTLCPLEIIKLTKMLRYIISDKFNAVKKFESS